MSEKQEPEYLKNLALHERDSLDHLAEKDRPTYENTVCGRLSGSTYFRECAEKQREESRNRDILERVCMLTDEDSS